jgi:hypothetical protein
MVQCWQREREREMKEGAAAGGPWGGRKRFGGREGGRGAEEGGGGLSLREADRQRETLLVCKCFRG